MYRRRQKAQEKKEEQKIEEVEVVKPAEPEIKKVIVPREAAKDYGNVPMVNILRKINYFNGSSETHAVPFEKMIDIAFSKGYLNVDDKEWYKETNVNWGTIDTSSEEESTNGAYTDTTNYSRSIFMSGDVIFTKDANKSFAFVITKVYSNYLGEDNSSNDVSSVLDYHPPVGEETVDDIDSLVLSSFVACNGNVYMFKKNATFGDIKTFVSTTGTEGDYVFLAPTNKSEPAGVTSDPNRTVPSSADKPANYPGSDDVPTAPTTGSENKFNLTNGVVVEGWFIYMRSSEEGSAQAPSNITGDIIRSGPIVIAKVGSSLSLGGSLRIPYVASSSESSSSTYSLYYDGNDTKFACEPLNSEQYQVNYGDVTGSRNFTITDSKIYSLVNVIKYAKQA